MYQQNRKPTPPPEKPTEPTVETREVSLPAREDAPPASLPARDERLTKENAARDERPINGAEPMALPPDFKDERDPEKIAVSVLKGTVPIPQKPEPLPLTPQSSKEETAKTAVPTPKRDTIREPETVGNRADASTVSPFFTDSSSLCRHGIGGEEILLLLLLWFLGSPSEEGVGTNLRAVLSLLLLFG